MGNTGFLCLIQNLLQAKAGILTRCSPDAMQQTQLLTCSIHKPARS